ncbi:MULTISPECIES: acetyl/propionyl/methylcrotonyl-CoA carboxylase subunit alpha [Alteromonas]|jgi:3-methylcrotonyl-CoA carboxylase alpha subunit|uniref:acetyl/propionyl/methylcrotonyl-CoA carboxylase subunit alpha n=1 Tax=Alteromonas TaxID=226 RepID=UPI00066AED4D|nr:MULTISPECIES: acetyl/propionyl/methylcrotonyl-CoA carboxylase subunit alpha [Alteromonas]MEC8964212.1 acetyl/propionyl/methylcrotonyl-CoA carboxylase subunit alpha [Pseudomonadota bacterium]MBC6984664.1 acetyl/propionyl/methylcrotonyl-CoA carboxylase subunit alpha [Alteromonas sp. BZK5]MEE3029117.1 acetyl/propionyl/methylcrotonyl-CoA carboxylase subunit alpha [Pseudomonadota bacterium]CAI3950488.1 3-methylcrotonoyl-CoA carboxylase [Alteromonas macleodii]VTP51960.1 3-methylcrotonoyl-CoA carb|tara:strand:+ start:754 stop:2772 length:2019 start_codon:yes stop_codon:yes gene_type:complete
MINKLLIANRGEIACRVIKTANAQGIKTVAVYSDADKNALHVQMADEAVYLGPSPSKKSYLRGELIIEKAKELGVDAIHPGYGFLSENAEFANLCAKNNIIFVGPPASAIEAMGSKSAAKHIMEKAGVPLVPGYHGDDQSEAVLKGAADEMGYPVLLKAAAGGGGKGMRQVWSEKEFSQALNAAKRESMASFGDDHMLVEKYLTRPRHVEIQVFCDTHGNGVYLFERDCSVQRRHQKIIEEAPAPNMSQSVREKMGEAAILAAKAINYVGAGTVEFLLDEDDSFYFMEMNTRLQVEHPVTEMITREDLVHWQLTIAEGKPLPKQQNELTLTGHAFEARIYAEDPNNEFLPSTGTLRLLRTPKENDVVRVDTGVVEGDEVSVFYDPMIAKLVVWGENREIALKRLISALGDYYIDGVSTNIDFLKRVATHPAFVAAELTTTFVEKHHDSLFSATSEDAASDDTQVNIPVMALLSLLNRKVSRSDKTPSVWSTVGAWRANANHTEILTLLCNQEEVHVGVKHQRHGTEDAWELSVGDNSYNVKGKLVDSALHATINGYKSTFTYSDNDGVFTLFNKDTHAKFSLISASLGDDNDDNGDANFSAPMNGTIVAHLVEKGVLVKKGEPILVMEAMKMEHSIIAPHDGAVEEFFFNPGELVDGGATLLAFSTKEAAEV